MNRVVVDKASTRSNFFALGPKLAIFFVVFSALLSTIVFTQDTFAAACPSNRQSCNAPEQEVYTQCLAVPNQRGALWFNNSDNSPTTSGYYSAEVRVSASQNTVTVYLRGSVNSCGQPGGGAVYAVNIKPSGPNAALLTNLQGTVLNRGNVSGNRNQWSSQGSSLAATLNVENKATNNIGKDGVEVFKIGIDRCFSLRPDRATGGCYPTDVNVYVTRAARSDYTITPTASADKSSAVPGDTITWTHSVKNNGPAKSAGITYGYNTNASPFGPTILSSGGTASRTSTYTVTQGDVGGNVCRATYARPGSYADPTKVIASASSCVNIPYSYALTPSVSLDHSDNASVGTVVNITPSVINAGPTKSRATDWQVSEFVVAPGNTPLSGGVSTVAPCSFYTAGVTSCVSPLNGDKGNTTFDDSVLAKVTNSKTTLAGTGYMLPDLPVGSRVCFSLSVKPNSATDGNWRHSTPICVVVSKSPLMHILGGDLRVGAAFVGGTAVTSQIDTSVTIKTGTSYGSWDEYGIAASGAITGMASGSSYNKGLACTINCATNSLSFANTPSIGNFKPTTRIPDVAAAFPVSSSTPIFSSLADASQRRVETANSDITITGGTIAKGTWLVINASTKTVTIKGDITYDSSPMQSLGDVPQLVIIANQINIEGTVKNVDAWLIASGSTGTINTCSSWKGTALAATADLTSKICSDPLVINGPVMANKLYLRRTAGSDSGPSSDNPAEVINLRPDAYLWGIARVGDSGRLTTVYSTELPPRF